MVKVSNNVTELLLKKRFDCIVEKNESFPGYTLLHAFFGDVNECTIANNSVAIEKLITETKYSKSIRKKAFAIAIEGLQNIFRHGLRNENAESTGAFIILDSEEQLQLHFLNLVQEEGVLKLKEFCKSMHTLTLEQTKEQYMRTLSTADLTDKGGASLGCLLMKLKSDGNIFYTFEALEEHITCFHLFLNLNKK